MNGSEKVSKELNADSKLYVIHQTYNLNDDFVKFQYYSYPIRTTQYYAQEELENEEDIEKQVSSLEKLLYNEYEYLFIIGTNEYFANNFGHMFENNEISEWTLYKINKIEAKEQVELIKVDK